MKNIKLSHTVSAIALGRRLIRRFTKYICSVRRLKVGKILLFATIILAENSAYCSLREAAAQALLDLAGMPTGAVPAPAAKKRIQPPPVPPYDFDDGTFVNPQGARGAATSTNTPMRPTKVNGRWYCPYMSKKKPEEPCGYSNGNKNKITIHIRTHTGEKPFKCPKPSCGFSTAQPSNLTAHIRTHPPTRPQMPAQRDYRERSQSPGPISRRERSPEPRTEQDDSSLLPVMSLEELDEALSYTNPTAPTNQEPEQILQPIPPLAEMSERNRELAEAYTKDNNPDVDLFEIAKEMLHQYEEFAKPLRPLYTEEDIWELWHNYPLGAPQMRL